MNYNYRTTYLHKNPTGSPNVTSYSTLDFEKFKGNRKYSTESWLNERLHILDVYMGIITSDNTSKRYIQYLNENNVWQILYRDNKAVEDLGIPITANANMSVSNNPDVIILRDIFS